uniref:Thiamine biosynthesis protein S n=1 Tax=Astrosyne radiata TaxID=1158023 RepID=A0A2U9NT90_9STRA|nr:thiamine biosynthesis protein S [Astrosyne radiata]AWT40344.1 thiamine biosynthesis protein S [Astrosyne radiata]
MNRRMVEPQPTALTTWLHPPNNYNYFLISNNIKFLIMTKFLYIYLNGQKYLLSNKINISQLINYFKNENIFFLIEYNNIIYNEKSLNLFTLNCDDKIEFITIVGGG